MVQSEIAFEATPLSSEAYNAQVVVDTEGSYLIVGERVTNKPKFVTFRETKSFASSLRTP